jgi:hypothetical protein
METQIIVRHGSPSSFDHCPRGTQCRVPFSDQFELFIQMSQKEDDPSWQSVGVFHQDTNEETIKSEIQSILG